jgi:probable addiction module antidote protein
MATSRYDTADYLDSEDVIAAYLTAVLDENDPALFVAALGDVARARGMTQISNDTGISRMGLYKSLSENGNPTVSTLQKVLTAFNLKLTVAPISQS